MAIGSKSRKNAIRIIIGLILLADIALIGVNWQLASAQGDPANELRALRIRRDLMSADIRRAEAIRTSLPGVQTETASFMEKDLRPTGAWSSTITDDLGALAKEAGVQLSMHFRQKSIDKRGVDEITISITMQGAYPSLVSFINSLERSKNFYLLDSLTLDSGSEGTLLKLNLELRTYFRS
jgi:Tfp pilus assembly protein PilO